MKLMNENLVLELVAASEKTIPVARKNLQVAGDVMTGDLDQMAEWVKKGYVQQTEIHADGKPLYLVFWHVNDQFGLHINLCVGLDRNDGRFEVLIAGVEALAKKIAAKTISFHTLRRGLIEKIKPFGYEMGGVQMGKRFLN